MSHNKVADGAGRALSKLLNGHSHMHTLNVCNNCIGGQGGIAIGHALANNTHLTSLNLRLNRYVWHHVIPIDSMSGNITSLKHT